MNTIYLDNAASTWPKPSGVKQAMMTCLDEFAANPGRGGHQLAMRASKALYYTRTKLAQLFHISNPNDLIFTSNATSALNQGIKGVLRPKEHVITTTLEHNSVRRPLEYLKSTQGIEISYVSPGMDLLFNISDFEKEIKHNTSLIIVTHASNLVGALVPIKEIGDLCKRYDIPFMVDASQTAGVFPIDVQEMNIQLLAFPGHKGLYGPQGTGGLYIDPKLDLEPLLHGGTGSHSEWIEQPTTRPDRYESGTSNTVGIAGLGAGVEFVLETGLDKIRQKEMSLTVELLSRLEGMNAIKLYGQSKCIERSAVVAFTIDGLDASEAAYILDRQYQIAVRAGYHCTPLGHETMGTLNEGAIRASFGFFNEMTDVDALERAVREIVMQIG